MTKSPQYYPDRCLECPELLNEATAGDRCAACVEHERAARADAGRGPDDQSEAGDRGTGDEVPANAVMPNPALSAG